METFPNIADSVSRFFLFVFLFQSKRNLHLINSGRKWGVGMRETNFRNSVSNCAIVELFFFFALFLFLHRDAVAGVRGSRHKNSLLTDSQLGRS